MDIDKYNTAHFKQMKYTGRGTIYCAPTIICTSPTSNLLYILSLLIAYSLDKEVPLPPRRTLINSAQILTAISSGVKAPISKPIGAYI